MVDLKITLISIILSLLISLSIVYYYPYIAAIPQPDFYPQNNSWNGLKEFVDLFKAVIINNANSIPNNGTGIDLFIIGPYYNFTEIEADYIKNFILTGGNLVLADNLGSGNSLLKYLSLNSSFSNNIIQDPIFFEKNKYIIKVFNSSLPGVSTLVFGPSTYIIINDEDAKVLARSSYLSYYKIDDKIINGPFPLIVEINYGKGKVYLISSPSIFTNYFIMLYDNLKLIQYLAQGIVYLLTSKLKQSTLYNFWYVEDSFLSSLRNSQIDYAIFLILTSIFIVLFMQRAETKKEDELDKIIKEHPDWDINILRKIKEDIKNE